MAKSTMITSIRALVVTEDATAAEWLSSQQWQVSPFHPRSVTSDKAHSVSTSIKAGSYGLVWLEIPRSGAAVPVHRRRAVNRQLALWMRQAHAVDTPACLFGLRGRVWQDESYADLQRDKISHDDLHQLCAYRLQLNSSTPSCVAYSTLSTRSLAGGKCRCPSGTEHHYGLSARLGMARQRLACEDALFRILIGVLTEAPQAGNERRFAFPKAAKEKEKEAKKAGKKATKRPKIVEDHYDDLGDDVSSILLACDDSDVGTDGGTSDAEDDFTLDLSVWSLRGPQGLSATSKLSTFIAANMHEIRSFLSTVGAGMDICELCSGDACTSTVAIRRRTTAGRNYDTATNCDMSDGQQQRLVAAYVNDNTVLCAIMAPRSSAVDPIYFSFCGTIAALQQQSERHFFCDQPRTEYRHVDPWPRLLNRPLVETKEVDGCMLMPKTNPDVSRAKESSILTSSSADILACF